MRDSAAVGGWTPPGQLRSGEGVFHYTSAEGLLGMLQQGVLWATEASGMNDVGEVVEGQEYVQEALRERAKVAGISSKVDPALEGVAPSWYMESDKPSGVFVLCASLEGDDANQWRLYANDGRGYAVELDTSIPFCVRTPRRPARPRSPEPGKLVIDFSGLEDSVEIETWIPVMYEDRDRKAGLESLIDWARDAYAAAEAAPATDPEEPSPLQYFYHEASQEGGRLARLIKGSGFRGEAEVRVTVTFGHGDRHVKYRASRYGVVRHVEVTTAASLKEDLWFAGKTESRQLPIRSVRLGPALSRHPQLAVPAVKSLLRRHGYEGVEVTCSEVTLR